MTQKNGQAQLFVGDVEFEGSVEFKGEVDLVNAAQQGSKPAASANVAVTSDLPRSVRRAVLTVTDLVVDVAAADNFGSAALFTLPDSNMMLLAVEADLELVKGETADGIVAATDVTVGIGTVATASADLSNAGEDDVLTGVALTATDASPAYQVHSSGDGSLTYPITIADGASTTVYLNIGASITADDTITAAGTIVVFYLDTGNEVS